MDLTLHQFPQSIRRRAGWIVMVAAVVAGLMVATAPASAQSRSEVVSGVLERYVSVLRRSGLAEGGDAAKLVRTLADDLDWVQPGDADGSPLYNLLVAAPSPPPPTEIEAIRDWINDLAVVPVRRCARGGDKPLTPEAVSALVASDLEARPATGRRQLRYLSLVALANRCAVSKDEADGAIQALLLRLAPAAPSATAERVGGQAPLWRVDLDAMKLTPAAWEALAEADRYALALSSGPAVAVARATGSARAIVRGDALAAAVTGPEPARRIATGPLPPLQGPLQKLVDAYALPLDAEAAAAELGVPAAALRRALFAGRSGRERQLLARRISRERFLAWYPRIVATVLGVPVAGPADPRPASLTGAAEPAEPAAVLTLVAERTEMATGDLVTVSVKSDRTCDLEVVDVDPTGRATLLFPNDFQRDGRLSAHARLDLPGGNAPYQFRMDRVGTETIVAHCYVPGSRRVRSEHEFVRQRFLDLGSWRDTRALSQLSPARTTNSKTPPKPAPSRLLARAALRLLVK